MSKIISVLTISYHCMRTCLFYAFIICNTVAVLIGFTCPIAMLHSAITNLSAFCALEVVLYRGITAVTP